MPEDDGTLVAVRGEQLDEPFAGVQQPGNGDHDVLEQRGRAGWTSAGDSGVEPLADVPESGTFRRIGGETRRHRQRQRLEVRLSGRARVREGLGALGVDLDEERGVPGDGDLGDRRRHVAEALCHAQRRRVQEFDRGQTESCQVGESRHRVGQRLEDQETGGDGGSHRDRPEAGLRDEGEGPLGADDQVLEDAHGVLEVEQRVQPVAHGVLHRELLAEEGHVLRRGEQTGAQGEQALSDRGLRRAQHLVGVGAPGVEDRAAGEDDRHRLDGLIRVLRDAARHAAGVVRDDAADRARDLARGIRAELAAVTGETGVDLAHGGPGTDPNRRPVVLDADVTEAAARVDQDVAADALTGEAGAPGPEGERAPGGTDGAESTRHTLDVGGGEDGIGDQQIVRGIVRAGEAVDGARVNPGRRAQQGGVQRFGECGRHGAPLLRRKIVRQVYRAAVRH